MKAVFGFLLISEQNITTEAPLQDNTFENLKTS